MPQEYSKLRNLVLGVLPADRLAVTGLGLEAVPVRFTIAAQKHAIKRHPDEFHLCRPYLERTVKTPTYVGQSPKHEGNGFELVFESEQGDLLILLAVRLKQVGGAYIVTSVYPINQDKLARRLRKGFLIRVG